MVNTGTVYMYKRAIPQAVYTYKNVLLYITVDYFLVYFRLCGPLLQQDI